MTSSTSPTAKWIRSTGSIIYDSWKHLGHEVALMKVMEAWNDGLETDINYARDEGYGEGRDDGLETGYERGYGEGYKLGYEDGEAGRVFMAQP